MAKTNVKGSGSSGLSWFTKMLQLFSSQAINIPGGIKQQTEAIEDALNNDVSGLVNSILDFGISAARVDFSVESSNKTVETKLNDWLKNINESLRGKIPTGVSELAKQYYIERWKKSSFILVRTIWETRDGFKVPTKLWLVDGKDIDILDEKESRELGSEDYRLKIGDNKYIKLPKNKNEKIFIQKPFESWTCDYPTPYLIKKGTYYNLKSLELLANKGNNVIAKALEYMMLLKKGDKDLAKTQNPDFVYSEQELKDIKDGFQRMMDDSRSQAGIPFHVSNFDTELEHIIPDLEKVLQSSLYSPIERRILASLGFIEVVEGVTTSRKDSVINPKVFMSEVQSAVNDFSSLMKDILMTIIEENRELRPKLTKADYIQIRTSPIKQFLSNDAKEFLRSLYDRGLMSKRTFVELCGDMDFDAEIERRNTETKAKLDDIMTPPMIQNINQGIPGQESPNPDKKTSPDKQGPEKKNYTAQSFEKSSVKIKEATSKTSKKDNHSHIASFNVIVDGEKILEFSGQTDEVDGHTHTISNINETDPAEDGHTHRLRFETSNLDIDEKTKLIKYQNLVKQASLLDKLNKDKE